MTVAEHTIDDSVDKLLVISDIHGFKHPLDYLDKIRTNYSSYKIINNGDLCCGGLDVPYVIDWLRENVGELSTRGNHDDTLIFKKGDPDYKPGSEQHDYLKLNQAQIDYVENMPYDLKLNWRGKEIQITHGHTARDGSGCSWRATPDEQIEKLTVPGADLCISSHTHYAYIHKGETGIYANTGSLSITINGVRESGTVHYQKGESDLGDPNELHQSFLEISCENGELELKIIRLDLDRDMMIQGLLDGGHGNAEVYSRWLREGIYPQS